MLGTKEALNTLQQPSIVDKLTGSRILSLKAASVTAHLCDLGQILHS